MTFPYPDANTFFAFAFSGFMAGSTSRVFMISCAFQILISPLLTKSSTTLSKISAVAPAAIATERA